MRVNIKKGIRPDVDLRRTCACSTIVEGPTGMQQIKNCGALAERVAFPVAECNQWQDRSGKKTSGQASEGRQV